MFSQRTTLILTVLISLLLIPDLAAAAGQYVGLIDHTEQHAGISPVLSYSRADFQVEGGDEKYEVINRIGGLQLDLSLSESLQVYGMTGVTDVDFGDTEVENGSVSGGGIQLVVEPNPDLYLKLTGSKLNHETQKINDVNQELEFKNDWQAGVLLGRETEARSRFENSYIFHSYTGIVYSDREVENLAKSKLFKLDNYSGLTLIAGFTFELASYLDVELEGQAGAMENISGRFTYKF